MRAEIQIEGLEEVIQRLEHLEIALARLQKEREPEKEWYTVAEAAEYLGMSTKSIYRLLQRGLLKGSAGIRHIRIYRNELESYKARTTV